MNKIYYESSFHTNDLVI